MNGKKGFGIIIKEAEEANPAGEVSGNTDSQDSKPPDLNIHQVELVGSDTSMPKN